MIERELELTPDGSCMDGFPRTVAQAQALDAMLASQGHAVRCGRSISRANRPALVARLASRWTNPRTRPNLQRDHQSSARSPVVDDEDGGPLIQREDDRAETVAKRLEVYDARRAARGVLSQGPASSSRWTHSRASTT